MIPYPAFRSWLSLLVVGLLGAPVSVQAEQFLGIEGATPAPVAATAPLAVRPKPEVRSDSHAEARSQADSDGPAAVGFRGGFSVGPDYVTGRAGVSWPLMGRWLTAEGTGLYERRDHRGAWFHLYGPEADLVARLPNRSIVTPYAGAGPGFRRWARFESGILAADGESWTRNAFAGVVLALTRHFGIVAERRQTYYEQSPPTRLAGVRDARSFWTSQLGFQVAF